MLSVTQVRSIYFIRTCTVQPLWILSFIKHNNSYIFFHSDDQTGSSRHGWKVCEATNTQNSVYKVLEAKDECTNVLNLLLPIGGGGWSSIYPLKLASIHSLWCPFILPLRYFLYILLLCSHTRSQTSHHIDNNNHPSSLFQSFVSCFSKCLHAEYKSKGITVQVNNSDLNFKKGTKFVHMHFSWRGDKRIQTLPRHWYIISILNEPVT